MGRLGSSETTLDKYGDFGEIWDGIVTTGGTGMEKGVDVNHWFVVDWLPVVSDHC